MAQTSVEANAAAVSGRPGGARLAGRRAGRRPVRSSRWPRVKSGSRRRGRVSLTDRARSGARCLRRGSGTRRESPSRRSASRAGSTSGRPATRASTRRTCRRGRDGLCSSGRAPRARARRSTWRSSRASCPTGRSRSINGNFAGRGDADGSVCAGGGPSRDAGRRRRSTGTRGRLEPRAGGALGSWPWPASGSPRDELVRAARPAGRPVGGCPRSSADRSWPGGTLRGWGCAAAGEAAGGGEAAAGGECSAGVGSAAATTPVQADPERLDPSAGSGASRALGARPVFQHLPYRDRGIGVDFDRVLGDGRLELLVTYLGSRARAVGDLRRLLGRYGDPGTAYVERYQRVF